jgi:hypothetical protein
MRPPRRGSRKRPVRTPGPSPALEEAVSEQADGVFWNRAEWSARRETSSNFAVLNDHERTRSLLSHVGGLEDWANDRAARLTSHQREAIRNLAGVLRPIAHGVQPSEPLARKIAQAVARVARLRLEWDWILGPLIEAHVETWRGFGDKEALRDSRPDLAKGSKRPHGWGQLDPRKEILVAYRIQVLIRSQRAGGAEEAVWSDIKEQLEIERLIHPQTLENFNKWVTCHLSDLLDELPPRAAKRRRR